MKPISLQRIRSSRSYTVNEAAWCLRVSPRTIYRWIDSGLATVDMQRPLLIHGGDLVSFVKAKLRNRKRKCPPAHLFCVRCREPRVPAGNMVDWLPRTPFTGLLCGICPSCGSLMHRAASAAKYEAIVRGLEVTLPSAPMRLSGPTSAPVSVSFKGGCHAET
jgi:hypothetical protein